MKWLSEWRQRLGLTQIQLSNKSGIDSNMISRYEREAAIPTLDTVRRLAKGLGVTVDELLNGPKKDNWDLKLVIAREGEEIDMTTTEPDATLSVKNKTMTISLTAGYELWEDDAKFAGLIEMLHARRAAGLKLRKKSW